MSRTISRPFGRAANTASTASAPPAQPPPQTASSSSMQSATAFVLQDEASDTPHGIHPHAAAYASQQPGAVPGPAPRTKTLRQMTMSERAAWAQLAGAPSAYPQAGPAPTSPPPPVPATSSTASAPAPAPQPDPDEAQMPYVYGNQAGDWGPHNEHLRLQYQPWAPLNAASGTAAVSPPATPTPSSPAGPAVQPSPPPTPSAPAAPASPLVLARPMRTSSLPAAGRATSTALVLGGPGGVPELEIVVSRPGGQDVTVRLFAPGRA